MFFCKHDYKIRMLLISNGKTELLQHPKNITQNRNELCNSYKNTEITDTSQ